ncbi:MAG: fibrobacter succinogenes major paralogous domain-containing protein, partial [Flavobacteriales bacterium]
ENLNTSIYRNGDPIPTNLNTDTWWNTTSGAWAYYNNDANYACPYGKLYNWYACADARQLCPVDWHVPTDAQLTVLINYLGGGSFAGGKMKTTGNLEASTGLWNSPNTGATNISGFSGIPAGTRRNDFQEYDFIGQGGYVWSSSENGSPYGWYRRLVNYNDDGARDYTGKRFGYSVRCLRD